METWENAALVGAGGLTMWVIQLIAGKFIDRKYTLEKEKFDKLVSVVERLDDTLTRLANENTRVQERIDTLNREVTEVKMEYRMLRDKVTDCELKIAKEHK